MLKKYNGTGGDVTIPNSVTSIGEWALGSWSKDQTIMVEGGGSRVPQWNLDWLSLCDAKEDWQDGCDARIVYE